MTIIDSSWYNDIYRGTVLFDDQTLYFALKNPPKNKEEYLERLLIEREKPIS